MGLAGSGKTTLARWYGETFHVPAYDLDLMVYDSGREQTSSEIAEWLNEIRRLDGWVTEGAYTEDWLNGLLADASAIVWLDLPPLTCEFRILKRHIVAEIARNNPHQGWRKLIRFLSYTRRTAAHQRSAQQRVLAPYTAKVVRCRSSNDVQLLKADAYLSG